MSMCETSRCMYVTGVCGVTHKLVECDKVKVSTTFCRLLLWTWRWCNNFLEEK